MSFEPVHPRLDNFNTTKKPKPEDIHVFLDWAEAAGFYHGMKRMRRKLLRSELFRGFDPDTLAHRGPPPPGLQAAFDRVYSKLRYARGASAKLKLAWHPLFPHLGIAQELEPGKWEFVTIFQEPTVKEQLPPCMHSPRWSRASVRHLAGLIGEVRMPELKDFEIILDLFYGENTADQVEAKLQIPENEKEQEDERVIQAYERDVLDYFFNMIHDEANGNTKQRSLLTIPLPQEQRNVDIQRNGYKLRAKSGTRVGEKLLEMQHDQVRFEDTHRKLESEARAAESYELFKRRQAKAALVGEQPLRQSRKL